MSTELHPSAVAWRILLSPHEWTWTQEEQEAMAREVVRQAGLAEALKRATAALENIKVHAGNYSAVTLSLNKCGQIARWGLEANDARPPDVPGSGPNPHPSVRNMVG